MGMKRDKEQIEQLKNQLKVAERGYVSKVRERDLRLLKLALVMVILAVVAGVIHGRVQIW